MRTKLISELDDKINSLSNILNGDYVDLEESQKLIEQIQDLSNTIDDKLYVIENALDDLR